MQLRTLFLLFLLTTQLFSITVEQIRTMYEEQKYQKCIDAAMESARYDNAKVQWYWGLSAEAVGDKESAISAYERILILEPSNVKAGVRLANLFSKMQMQKSADEVVESLQSYALTPQQRMTLASLRSEPADALSDLAIRASLRLGYDDNINFGSGSGSSVVNSNGVTVSGKDTIGSSFVQFQGDLTVVQELADEDGWFLRSDLTLYAQENFKAHRYDLYYGKAYAGPGYRFENAILYIPLFYGRMRYLQKDLLQEYGIRPDLNWMISPTVVLSLYGNLYQKRYLKSADRSSDSNVAGGGFSATWLQAVNYIYACLKYDDHSAERSNPLIYTDKAVFTGTIGGRYRFDNRFDVTADFTYRKDDYDDDIVPAGGQRDDRNHQFGISVENELFKQYQIEIEYRHITNHSDYALADYDKQIMTLGLQYNY